HKAFVELNHGINFSKSFFAGDTLFSFESNKSSNDLSPYTYIFSSNIIETQMFDLIRIYRDNYKYIRYEKRELAKIRKIPCDPSQLREISESELREIFVDPVIEKSWNKAGPLLNLHCNIADDT